MSRMIHPTKDIFFVLLLLTGLLAGISNTANGQAIGDYGTRNTTGNWGTASDWVVCTTAGSWAGAPQATTIPNSTKNVWIRSGHTMTENVAAACKDLTINGTLNWGKAHTLNASGSLVISGGTLNGSKTGILNVSGSFSVPAGFSASIQRVTLTISGTSTISGTINFVSNLNGTKTFRGLVTVNSGGTWSNTINEDIIFQGGLINNGTFTAGTGIYTFATSAQSISGSVPVSIPNVTVNGITLTNTTTLSVNTNLTGTGILLQAANSTLNIGGTVYINTLAASATGNTVNYYRAGIQTLKAAAYYNLTLSGTSAKTLPNTLTSVTNNLTVSGSASTATTASLTVGNLIVTGTSVFTAAGYPFTVTGTTNIQGGTFTISSATGTKIFTGLVTINAGATWNNAGSSAVTFRGGITNLGTFNAGNGIHTFNTNNQALTGTFTIPNVTVTGVTLTNNNTLSISAALSGTGGLTQAESATLNLGGITDITTLTAIAGSNTVNYNGGVQSIHSSDYYHLVLSGSGTKTLPSAHIIVAGDFSTSGTIVAQAGEGIAFGGSVTLGSGTWFNAGPYTYTVAGNWQNNGATFSASTSAFSFNGSVAQTIGGTSSTTFYDLISANSQGITLAKPINAASLALNSGKITTTSANILTITGSAPDDVITTSSTSYINGPFARTLPSGLVNGTYLFPVGKLGYNPLTLVDVNIGAASNIVVVAEVFDTNSGGTAGVGLSSLNTDRYWSALVTSGTAFTSAKIQLTEAGLSAEDAIGKSATRTGFYDRISNAPPSANTITSDPVTSLGYFVIGQKPMLSIVATSYGTEGGSNGLFTITTSKQFTVARTVNLILTGTATNGTDYTTINTTVTFPAFQSTLTIPVTVTDDAAVEPTESVIVTLVDGTGYALGTPSSATVNILDNDIAGITITPVSGLITTEAGGTATFIVKLTSQPTANVTIGFSSSNMNEGTVSPVSLIFTSVNWNIPQSVTVTGVNDFVKDGDIAYHIITAPATSADVNYKNMDASDVSVFNQDDDVVGITVSPVSGLTTTEAGVGATFTMVLTSQPTADVSVALSSDNLAEGIVSPSSVIFTAANWKVAQTVTVTGVNDFMVDGNVLYHIVTAAATSADPNYAGINAMDVSVTNMDDDMAGITVNPLSGLVTSEAGGKATFTIVLNSQPSAEVLINITSDNTSEGTVTPASVTFTSDNWDVPQTITITGIDDSRDDGNVLYHILTSAAFSSDVQYSGLFSQTVSVTNDDNDIAGISVSPTTLTTTEAAGTGHSKTFTIVLNTIPSATVTIGISSSNTNEGTVSPASVTFTTTDWDIPKVVTVTGVDDFVDDGDQVYTVVTTPAAGGDYAGLNATDVTVINQDDDVAGVTVTPTSGLNITEAGGTASFTIRLNSQPTANVAIGISSNDLTEGTVSPASVTFSAADWSTPKTITVTGVNDYVQDGDIAFTIVTAQATSVDPLYSVVNPPDVSVINKDDDTAGYTIAPSAGLVTTEAGGVASFTIRLNSEPTANVTVSFTSNDTGEGTVTPSSVTFTPLNWNSNQTVAVTGADDFEMDGDILYTIVTTVNTGADLVYNAKDPLDVTVTNKDNDVAGIIVNPISGLVTSEAGGKATFTVKLTSQPTATVTIGLSSSNTGEGTVPPSSVTFTAANWNINQTITVTGVNDFIQDGNVAYSIITAPATSTDLKYKGMDALDVSVTNTDDDVAGITVAPISGLITTESGGTDRFTVVLTSQPIADVTIGISSSKTNEGTVSAASLTFTSTNWNIARTVTVIGKDDYSVDGDIAYTIVTAPATSSDPNYNSRDAADVSVTNKDNDVAGITVSPFSGLTTSEDGGQATFTITLNTIPTDNVTIALSSSNTAEGSVLPTSVTIAPADWNKPVAVTITGVDDFVDDGDITYAIVTAAAVSSDPKYNGMNPSDVVVTNVNDDAAGITVTAASGLTTTETGGAAIITIVLDSRPTADVIITFTSSNISEGTVTPVTYRFTSSNWNTPYQVIVTGKDDNSNDGDIAYTITSSASSTDLKYNGKSGEPVSVTNLDNDTPGVLVTPTSGLVTTEAGGQATFTMVLVSKPKNDVVVTLTSDNTTEGTVSPASVTFTAINWSTARTITVTGVNDALADGDIEYSIQNVAASSDNDFNEIDIADVFVTNNDLTPTITSFSPSSVCTVSGTSVVITGTFLSTANSITINGVNSSFTVNSAMQVTAVLSDAATTGKIKIITATGTAESSTSLTINRDGSWTGAVNSDWNNPANWACNQLPSITTNVLIASSRPRYPVLSSGVAGMARDLIIESGASVTVADNTLQIAGIISNSGTFTSNAGTIEMKGTLPQTIGGNVFAANTLMNLIVNNSQGVTLQGPLNLTGYLKPLIGDLNTGGHLTLISKATQTALIEGAGTGSVSGIVNMQRYLPSTFGYKYFSSPFKAVTVGAFATWVNLTEPFPTFYKYDEKNSTLNKDGSTSYISGWVKYTTPTSPLIPMMGYAANLKTSTTPVTVTLSGEVNNGTISLPLENNKREYTKGFNLVGNPYPSPIDWDAIEGWTKENIDGSIYFFNAGTTDRYTGIYTSYVNGQATGSEDHIIAAMQGFFVHVSDIAPQGKGTLGITNAVRTNNLNPSFKRAVIDSRPTLRLTAGFQINNAIEDAAVVYFDPTASVQFEKEKDALKLENTDELVPNIYTIAPGSRKLSINGLSEPSDSVSFIPLGITTFKDGVINFRAEDANDLPFMQVYLADALTGKYHDLRQSPDVSFSLQRGVYDNRFKLVFSKATLTGHYPGLGKLFTLVRSGNRILVKVDLPDRSKGNLMVNNLLGQTIMRREVSGKQTVEINQSITTGVFVITLVSGQRIESEKILMRQDYE